MKDLIILGVTGSVGTGVLETIRGKDFCVRAVSCKKNLRKAERIIEEFSPEYLAVADDDLKIKEEAEKLQKRFPDLKMGFGADALKEAVRSYPGDVVNAISGIAGLAPTAEALRSKKNVMLANKETLVAGGEKILGIASENNVRIIPIDSEHNALYRLLLGIDPDKVNKLIITASGGAFVNMERDRLANVTIADALCHPNWRMGAKITVDCATMANKGLEVIEAHHLFGIPYDRIETVIHPESIIHSMVEYKDNSIGALLYRPSMLIPIQYALTGEIKETNTEKIDFSMLQNITFRKMDFNRFPLLKLAYEAGKEGGLMPAVYNAANEAATELFLGGKIGFMKIEEIVDATCRLYRNRVKAIGEYTIEDIIALDKKIKSELQSQEGEKWKYYCSV